MDPRAALLANILADPADDGLRLVYADALEEWGDGKGDLARAEFVRVQVGLEGWRTICGGHGPGRLRCPGCALRRRERELLEAHWLAWFGGLFRSGYHLGYNGTDIGFRVDEGDVWATPRRGFVASLTLPSAAWLKHGDALLAASPITDVALADWPGIMWVSGSGPMTLHTFAGTHFTGEWFRVGDINPYTWRPAYRDPLARPKPRESCQRYVARELLAGRWGDRVTFTLPA